jgi:hypothetical protein
MAAHLSLSKHDHETPAAHDRGSERETEPTPSEPSHKNGNLEVYLHDHLAGATMALELLDHMIKHAKQADRKAELVKLKEAISADHDVLADIVKRLGLEENMLKKATAWIGEKVARLKLSLSDDAEGTVGLLQAMEVLSLGVAGKLALWDALRATKPFGRVKIRLNLRHLISRAKAQRAQVEAWRIEAARDAFV